MASEILGLFGTQSPQQLQQDYLSNLMVSPAQIGSQGLLQQLVSTGANAGTMMGYGAGRLLGGKVAGEVEASQIEDVLQQVNKMNLPSNYEKMQAMSSLLAEKGLTKQAMIAGAEAEKLKPKDPTIDLLAGGKYTTESLAKFQQSKDINDLVRVIEDRGDGTQVVEADGRQVLINKATGAPIRDLGAARPVAAGNTVINKPGIQESAEAKAYGTDLVENYKNIRSSAKTSANTKVAFETQLNTLNKGFDTGFGTDAQAAAANVLGALGVESAKDFATNAQVFKAAASSAILTKQLEQKGPQTEADAKRIEQTSAQLGNTKEANTFLAKVGIALANRDIKQRDFYSKWRTENKTFEGAEEAWLAGEGGKSLFDSPELKQYKRTDPTEGIPGQGGSSAIRQPTKRFNPATGKIEVIGG
jgi:hypothetical protein